MIIFDTKLFNSSSLAVKQARSQYLVQVNNISIHSVAEVNSLSHGSELPHI